MSLKVVEVENLKDFVAEINSEYNSNNRVFWFRGHSKDVSYKLLPSLYRPDYIGKADYYENMFLNTFKARAISILDSKPKTDLEWFFLMQHYDLPTRLLDWSEQALIALLFAVRDQDEALGENAVVWVLDPFRLNQEYPVDEEILKAIIPNIVDENDPFGQINRNYMGTGGIPPHYPIAILPPHNNKRIIAQKGVFTLFPRKVFTPLEANANCADYLWKIELKCSKVKDIKKELISMGINEVGLFPELDKLAKGIISDVKSKVI